MRLAFRSICYSALAALLSATTSQLSLPKDNTPSNLIYSGLYKIFDCNAHLPARLHSEATQLQNFLPQVWNSNGRVLVDNTNGTNSKFGFGAFFKTNSSINTLSSTIRNMRYGPSVGPGHQVPTMVCLDSSSEDPALQGQPKQTCVRNTVAIAISNSSYIGFCPSFFEVNRMGLDFQYRLITQS